MQKPHHKCPVSVLMSLTASMAIGLMGTYVLPYVVGALASKPGVSLEQAGWIGGIQIWAVAVSACITSLLLKRISWRRSALIGGVAAAVGWAFCARASETGWLVACQVLSGVGAGCVLSIVSAAVAATGDSERIYGRIYTITSLAFAALLYILPLVQTALGNESLFVGTAAVVLVLTMLIVRLPRRVSESGPAQTDSLQGRRLAVSFLFASMTLTFATFGGVYAYSEQAAVLRGLSAAQVGWVFGLSTATATLGAMLAVAVGTRFGRSLPLVSAIIVAGGSYYLVLSSHTTFGYSAGMLLYGGVSTFFNSYAYGTAASLDRDGRVVGALQGYSLVPYALGAGLVGTMASHMSLAAVGVVCLIANIIAAVIVLPALRFADGKSRESRARLQVIAPVSGEAKASKS